MLEINGEELMGRGFGGGGGFGPEGGFFEWLRARRQVLEATEADLRERGLPIPPVPTSPAAEGRDRRFADTARHRTVKLLDSGRGFLRHQGVAQLQSRHFETFSACNCRLQSRRS